MTLVVNYEETSPRVDSRSLKRNAFYHLLGVAIPRVNDLLFRRQLFATVWVSRKEALNRIHAFLEAGKRFDTAIVEADLSVLRDYALLFGTKERIVDLLKEESLYLPQNQTHRFHNQYALLAHLCRTRPPSAALEARSEDAAIVDLQTQLDKETPQVTDSWMECWVEVEETGTKVGPRFAAPTDAAAAAFENDINATIENSDVSKRVRGLYALGFVDPDPLLFAPKNIEWERKIVTEILTLQVPASRDDIDLNDSRWSVDSLPSVEAEEA